MEKSNSNTIINAISQSENIYYFSVDQQLQIKKYNPLFQKEFNIPINSEDNHSIFLTRILNDYNELPQLLNKIDQLFNGTIKEVKHIIEKNNAHQLSLNLMVIDADDSNKSVSEVIILGTKEEIQDPLRQELQLDETVNFFEFAGDAVIIGDEKMHIIMANQKMCELTGRTKEEILGKHVSTFFPKETLTKVPLEYNSIEQGDLVLKERKLNNKDGSSISIEMHSRKINNNYISIIRDISQREKAHSKIKELSHKLLFIAKMERIGIIDIDISLQKISFNEEMCLIMDNKTMNKCNRISDWIDLIHPDDKFRVEESLEMVKSENSALHFVYRIILKDGSIKTIKASADVQITKLNNQNKLIITSVDITNTNFLKLQLKESEQTFKTLTETATSAIFIYQEKFLYVNPAFEKITGYSLNEAKQMAFWELIHPDHLEMVKNRGMQRITGEFVVKRYEFKIITREGKTRWFEFAADKINYFGKPAAIGSAFDITARKEMELKLKDNILELESAKTKAEESEVKFRHYLEQNSAIMMAIDPITKKITFANHAAAKLYGYSRNELTQMTIYDLHTWSKDEVDNRMKLAIKSDSNEFQFTHRKKNNELVEVIVNASPVISQQQTTMVLIIHDITDEIKSKIALKKSHDTYRNILNSISEAIYIHDKDGKFIFVNQNVEKMYGYSKEDFIGSTPEFLSAPGRNNLEEVGKMIYKALQGETQSFEFWGLRKDGSIFPKEVIVSPGFFFGEKVTIAVARDVTEQKSNMNELIQAKNKAEESDQLKSAFLANMSHEIRTPMNAILGFSELVKDPEMEEDEKMHFLGIINKSSYHLLNLINDLVDISKLHANQMKIFEQDCNLNSLLYQVYEYFEGELINQEKQDDIKIVLTYGLPYGHDNIITDKDRLQQILNNIIGNAIKFTKEGEINISYKLENSQLIFTVKDNGIGIGVKQQEKIFDRFSQADSTISREYGGTGLGLAISKSCTDLLGGEIWCKSELGMGTSMQFSIPFTPSQNQ